MTMRRCRTTTAFVHATVHRPLAQTASPSVALVRLPPTPRPTSFLGRRVTLRPPPPPTPNASSAVVSPRMLIDPWSVSPSTLDALAAQFFALSLFPYLAFLYYLSRPETDCPPLANFGFRFLLVFVFATIPAGIYAKLHYNDILANIDWLHGTAESLLTITNLLIVLGFRDAISKQLSTNPKPAKTTAKPPAATLNATALPLLIASATIALSSLTFHPEPTNALSFPTWIIHVSSLLEWLVAMGLVWTYARITDNPKWRGLTWGMLPLHTSGICACTYHFFYNAPPLNALVTVQAALTCFGNATLALAAYRIYRASAETSIPQPASAPATAPADSSLVGFEDLGDRLSADSNATFFGKVFLLSALASAGIKWGSLGFDAPFQHSTALASAFILVPTALNMLKWAVRSRTENEDFGGFL